MINLDKHIWEGWTVGCFIKDLEQPFKQIMTGNSWQAKFTSKKEIVEWCKNNQPYYKKSIPEVVKYFTEKMEQYNK